MSFIFVLLGTWLLAFAHVAFWRARLEVKVQYSREYRFMTVDSAVMELRRLAEPSAKGFRGPPILLVHGIGANHRNLDMDEDHSLARYLGRHGKDVWLVTLRSGLKQKRTVDVRLRPIAEIDLPLAITLVREHTLAPKIDVVGFSLGGFLLISGLGRTVPFEWVRRWVSIASPLRVISNPFFRMHARVRRLPIRRLPLKALGLLGVPWIQWVKTPLHGVLYNPANMCAGTVVRLLANVVFDIETSLSDDVLEELSEERLQKILILAPAARNSGLLMVGMNDSVTDIAATTALAGVWGIDSGNFARLTLVGKVGGADLDFGHADLLFGRSAPQWVFRPVLEFFES